MSALVRTRSSRHHPGVEPLDRGRLPLVERLALGHALDDVDEDDGARQLLLGEALRGSGAHVAGAHHGDFVEHRATGSGLGTKR